MNTDQILIVDDDPEDGDMLRELIGSIDAAVIIVVFTSGEEAVQYLRQCVAVPAFIFLDINMGGMDGKETLLKIKSMKAYARTSVIMCSGQLDGHEENIYRKLGAHAFIQKSLSTTALRKAIESVLKKKNPV